MIFAIDAKAVPGPLLMGGYGMMKILPLILKARSQDCKHESREDMIKCSAVTGSDGIGNCDGR